MSSTSSSFHTTEPARFQKALHPVVLSLVLAALVASTFWPVLQHQFIIYDDADYVTSNKAVLAGLNKAGIVWAFTSTDASNWHPFTWLSHMLDSQLYGLQPWGHHLTSLLLHILNTVLVFLVFRKMTRAVGRSFVVAALFGLHPLHVESVAWVAERKDVLSTMFCLLTILAYVFFVQARPPASSAIPEARDFASDSWRAPAAYALCLIFFISGLLSKPMLVTLPFALLLLDHWPLNRLQSSSFLSLIVEKIPFFLLAAASCAITFIAQNRSAAVVKNLPIEPRVSNALVTYWRYLGKFFWPANLSVFYPYPMRPWSMGVVLIAGLSIGGVSLLAFALAKRKPYFPVGWFWFLGTLVPVIGVIQVGSQSMADRYTYIPSIGVFVVVVWAAWDVIQHWLFRMAAAATIASAAVLSCLIVTRQELGYWHDGETLFRRAVAVTPPNAACFGVLAEELMAKKRYNESIPLSRRAIELAPGFADVWQDLGAALVAQGNINQAIELFQNECKADSQNAKAHQNLGIALSQAGRWTEAAAAYEEAVRLNRASASAHRGLGHVLAHLHRDDEALNEYQSAIRLNPEAQDHGATAQLLVQKGRSNEALDHFRQALQMEPTNGDFHLALGLLLGQMRKVDESISQYEAMARLDTNSAQAHYLLGGALAEKGELDPAITQFRAALSIQPEYPDALNDLGLALNTKGQFQEAMIQLQKGLRLSPENPELHNNLGASLSNLGKLDEAIAEFREALRLNPNHAGAKNNLDLVLAAKGNHN